MPLLPARRRPDWSGLPAPNRALRVTVVMPVRDEARRLPGALRALAGQRELDGARLDPARFEVIVLANNCSDASAQVVRRVCRAPSGAGAARRGGALPRAGRACRPCPRLPDGRGLPARATHGRRRRRDRQHRRRHARRERLAGRDAARDRRRRRRQSEGASSTATMSCCRAAAARAGPPRRALPARCAAASSTCSTPTRPIRGPVITSISAPAWR